MNSYKVASMDFYNEWTVETFDNWGDARDYLMGGDSVAELEVNDIDIMTGHSGYSFVTVIEFNAAEAEAAFIEKKNPIEVNDMVLERDAAVIALLNVSDNDDDDEPRQITYLSKPAIEQTAAVYEVARWYGLTESAVRLACEQGRVEARKSGSTWIVDRASAGAVWGKSFWITSQHPLVIDKQDQQIVFESGSYHTVRHGWVCRYVVMQGSKSDGMLTLPSGAILRWTVGSPEYPGSARIESAS